MANGWKSPIHACSRVGNKGSNIYCFNNNVILLNTKKMFPSFICLWYLRSHTKISQQIILTFRLIILSEIILAHLNGELERRACKSKGKLGAYGNKFLINEVLGCLQKCFGKYWILSKLWLGPMAAGVAERFSVGVIKILPTSNPTEPSSSEYFIKIFRRIWSGCSSHRKQNLPQFPTWICYLSWFGFLNISLK